MNYKLLGKSGIRVSELSLGGMTFGTDWGFGADKDESQKIFDTYLNAGGNFIDTANIYTRGTSETLLGEFIQSERQNLVIASKYTLSEQGKINLAGNHIKNMMQSVEDSLKRLNTPYIDLYYVHAWDFTTHPQELMRSLENLVAQGKILTIGISDTPAWLVSRCNTLAELKGWSPFVAYQIEYCLTERTSDREILPMAEADDMAICGWGPLGAGLLTGKYLTENDEPKRMKPGVSLRLTERNLNISKVVVDLAKESGCSPAQLALNWQRRKSKNMVTLFGVRSLEQLHDNLGCLEHEMSDEQFNKLEEASKIDLGFPHDFLQTKRVQEIVYGDHMERLI